MLSKTHKPNKKLFSGAVLKVIAFVTAFTCVSANTGTYGYIDTSRDTRPIKEKTEYVLNDTGDYELLLETDTMQYYFRDDRDVFLIRDKRNGYEWKTGIDVPFSKELKKNIEAAETDEEREAASVPREKNLNTTYTGIANSLITVEYSEKETTKYISSASESGAKSKLMQINNDPRTWKLDVNLSTIDLKLSVYITLNEDSISYDIPFSGLSGEGKNKMTAVLITPFLGASGGEAEYYDKELKDYGEAKKKYMVPGYVFVPDGSGALIRFNDNNVAFNAYVGDVYGSDPSTEMYYYNEVSDAVPIKSPVMPVYGIAHGFEQSAFVAWADKGAEHMEIIVNPEETRNVKYTWAYPRFEYNLTYYQVYNNAGSGYFTLMNEPSEFDISMTYRFLSGDGSTGYRADYTGMALAYREHLMDTNVLHESTGNAGDIPMRVDFLMSDVKKSVVGTELVVTTDTDGVKAILDDLISNGITNINSGLIGWQKDSETLSKPDAFKFTSKIGTKKDFVSLFEEYADKGIDISFSRDFVSINKKMLSYYTNSAKHVNTWYLEVYNDAVRPENCPVEITGYALPAKTAAWIDTVAGKVSDISSSLTITGASNILTGTYDRNGVVTSLTEAEQMIAGAVASASEKLTINLENPNSYLWEYTDRYLQTPVGTSQYVFETDSVPFLQMVLYGTMELYGPYSNFSFYTASDILRMIDYNISPSFVFTKEPSYLLADTASSGFYSTEYEQYRELAKSVYNGVNEILSEVAGYRWTSRDVLESGVICNTYEKNGNTRYVVINYTENDYIHNGTNVPSLGAKVIK